jgi:hypothetical protein
VVDLEKPNTGGDRPSHLTASLDDEHPLLVSLSPIAQRRQPPDPRVGH